MERKLSLPHILASNQHIPECRTCTAFSTSLINIVSSGQSGCSSCALLYLAIIAYVEIPVKAPDYLIFLDEAPRTAVPEERLQYWYRLLEVYMNRNITQKMDCFPGLSGIASEIHRTWGGDYLAGIWSYDLPEALLWSNWGSQSKIPSKRISPYIAPSWSWACLEASKSFPDERKFSLSWPRPEYIDQVWATVQEAICTPKGRDPFGEVSKGHIKLTAPVLEATWRGVAGAVKLMNVEFSDFDTSISLDFDLQFLADEPLCLLLLGSRGKVKDEYSNFPDLETYPASVSGLLIRSVSSSSASHKQVFERIGTCGLGYDFNGWSDYKYKESYLNIVDFLKTSPESTLIII
jgi:hypothetical protein